MDLDFILSNFNQPELVQKKKKYATFTVREIGGQAEVEAFRRAQAVKEEAYRMRLKSRDERAAEFQASFGQKIDSPTVHTTSWAEKVAFVAAEKAEIAAKRAEVTVHEPWVMPPEPKRSLKERVKQFFKRIWQSANF